MAKESNVRKRPLEIKKMGGAIEFAEAEVETNVNKIKPCEFQDFSDDLAGERESTMMSKVDKKIDLFIDH